MARNWTLLAAIGLTACSQYELQEIPSGSDGDGDGLVPDIVVDPDFIQFDTIDIVAGDEPITVPVTVSNVGEADLHIQDLYLEAGDPSYILSSISSVLIAPGASAEFTVTFDPVQPFEIPESVLIDSDDPDTPTAEVELIGDALAPQIELDPQEIDFGFVDVGCETDQPIYIRNTGNAPLTIDEQPHFTRSSGDLSIFFGNDPDVVDSLHEFPLTIDPGEQIEIWAEYLPLDDVDDSATLTVESNDPYRPEAIAEQFGGIAGAEEQIDYFEQPPQPMTDVAFVVDNSCSMSEEQASLADNFATFMFGLSLTDADFRIAVITTDSPSFRGEIITPDTLNPVTKFTDQAVAGTGGSGTERGLQMLYECVQPGGDCSPEATGGFMRDDALFAAIFVSDEPDQSSLAASSYVNYLWTLKDDPDLVRLHAIAGDVPTSACSSAQAGFNYDSAVDLTGGNFLSICASDWGSHMSVLAEGSVSDLSQFKLSETPVEDTIEVFVDSKAIAQGWFYTGTEDEGGSNAVKFQDEYIPEGGSEVRIEYVVKGDCAQ